jgi:hypothetical protein
VSARRRARLTSTASIVSGLVLAVLSPVPRPVAAQPAASASPEVLVTCGDGPAFPLAALDGPQGAEMGTDGAARRLAQAATTGEAGYVPRGGWMRVLGEADRVLFATWLRPPRPDDEPLLQLTVVTDAVGSTDPDDWRIASAGFCRPRVVPPQGSGTVPWTLERPVDPASTSVRLVPAVPVCADPPPAVAVHTPGHVSLTVLAPTDGHACVGPPSPTLEVVLTEPIGPRDLVDGAFDPPALVQAGREPGPAASPPIDPASVSVTASARPTSIVASHAIADSLDTGPSLVEIEVIDELALQVTLASATDVVLAGPPQLCLVGPFPAPDDAGLIDRCWGDPDPGAVLAPDLERDAAGHPILRAGVPLRLDATIARGDIRCDYPPGDWRLEVVLTPLVNGHGWTDVALPPIPLAVDASGLVPARELTRSEARSCGMAVRPPSEASSAP